jgi:hypothetical protein
MPPTDNSIDYSVKDLLLENLYTSNKEPSARIDQLNRAGQPNFHLNLATLVRNLNKNNRFEIQRQEDQPKPSIDQNKLKKQMSVVESTQGQQPLGQLEENGPELLKSKSTIDPNKESPIGSLRKKYWDLVNENNKFKSDIDALQHPSCTEPPSMAMPNEGKVENRKSDDTS